jgi:hypothetical protein
MTELYIVLSVTIAFVAIFILIRTKKRNSPTQSKADIIQRYKQKLKSELSNHQDNQELYKQKKMQLLKAISIELSRNIFFEKDEIPAIITQLANDV